MRFYGVAWSGFFCSLGGNEDGRGQLKGGWLGIMTTGREVDFTGLKWGRVLFLFDGGVMN